MSNSKRLLITMSGGTTTVINATLTGLIEQARQNGFDRVYAGLPGILGVLQESLADLSTWTPEQLETLAITPGSGVIGTTRITPLSAEEIQRFLDVVKAYGITHFVNIGGNGTIKQSKAISQAISSTDLKIAAAPKTVDNDLGDAAFEDVYFTPGYPSCVQFWAYRLHLMNEENRGAASHDRVLIAQTFGRRTGFLSGCVRAADESRQMPLLLLLPEDEQPIDRLMGTIDQMLRKRGRVMIVLSEGYAIDDVGERHDLSGQVMYGSSRTTSAQLLVNRCMDNGFQARAYIPTMDQRLDIRSSTQEDLDFSRKLGRYIVQTFEEGQTHFLASIARQPGQDRPELRRLPLQAIGDYSRTVPSSWIRSGQFDVSDEFIRYARPFVTGSHAAVPFASGLPVFLPPATPLANKKLPVWSATLQHS